MVPFHALPKLHEAIKADCAPPYDGTVAAYREILPAILRQAREPSYFVARSVPAKAA
jgi:fatty acid desaturase